MIEMEDEKAGSNLTRRIVDVLGRAIVTEQFSQASPFPVEAELCERYGASRTIVREAVKMRVFFLRSPSRA